MKGERVSVHGGDRRYRDRWVGGELKERGRVGEERERGRGRVSREEVEREEDRRVGGGWVKGEGRTEGELEE